MMIDFVKYSALRNDFVVVVYGEREEVVSDLAKRCLDRKEGVGGDDLLVVRSIEKGRLSFCIVNPDGTFAETCGNALRVMAFYGFVRGFLREGDVLEVPAGERRVLKIERKGVCEGYSEVEVVPRVGGFRFEEMKFQWKEFEVYGYFSDFVGNPHLVVFDPPADVDVEALGRFLENHPRFPNRTNVTFLLERSGSRGKFRFWERGVGETESCVTGSTTAFLVGREMGIWRDEMIVSSNGGELVLRVCGETVCAGGEVREVARGTLCV